ncbi:polysaccharide pyruvyl transferase family protein [Candidatus Nitrospira bockiana]
MKVLIEHRSGANLGDIAMIEGTVARLRLVCPDAEIYVPERVGFTTDLWRSPRVHRVRDYAVSYPSRAQLAGRRFWWRYASTLEHCAQWVLTRTVGAGVGAGLLPVTAPARASCGGGTLADFCRPFDALLLPGQCGLTDYFPDCLIQQCCTILAFAEQGKPVLLTGQQLGPLRNANYRRLVGRALRAAVFLGLREPTETISISREAGCAGDRVELMGDDSFALPAAHPAEVDACLDSIGMKDRRFIAVNIRLGYYAREHSRHVEKIAAVLNDVADRSRLPLVFVPTSFEALDSDVETARHLAGVVPSLRVLDGKGCSAGVIKGAFGRAVGAVCISYHACTFALSQGVPAVCLYDGAYYGQKARGLCAFWGDERLGVDLQEMEAGEAAGAIMGVIEDDAFRCTLGRRAASAIETWNRIFESRMRAALQPSEARPARVGRPAG